MDKVGKKENKPSILKCQRMMVQAVIFHQRFPFSWTELFYCSKNKNVLKKSTDGALKKKSRYIKDGKKFSNKGKKVRKVVCSLKMFSKCILLISLNFGNKRTNLQRNN